MICPRCGQSSVKCGKDGNGFQRFRCSVCLKKFTEPHALSGKHTNIEDACNVLSILLEGMSVRSCERLTGIHRDTILGLMIQAGESCRTFMESTIVKHPASTIEVDEQWAFILCKRKTAERRGYDESKVGDCYVFTAIDRDSKLLLCWHAGERDRDNTWTFTDKLYRAVSGRPTINTDGFPSYASAIPTTFRQNVDYAQVIKHFQNGGGDAQQRYSPGAIRAIEKKIVCGKVEKDTIGTSRMERFNLTTRMHIRRFTRLTNGHSKKRRNHEAMLGLYFSWYNWCRKHLTLKTTSFLLTRRSVRTPQRSNVK